MQVMMSASRTRLRTGWQTTQPSGASGGKNSRSQVLANDRAGNALALWALTLTALLSTTFDEASIRRGLRAAPPPSEQENATPNLRVTHVGDGKSTPSPLLKSALKLASARATPVAAPSLKDALGSTDVLVLDSTSAPHLNETAAELIPILDRAVRSGLSLVILEEAAAALPANEAYADLIGRQRIGPTANLGNSPTSASVSLAIVDQKHPVTQCITHLFLNARPTAVGRRNEIALAKIFELDSSKFPSGLPTLWVRRHGRGVVLACALKLSNQKPTTTATSSEKTRDPLARSAKVTQILVARALQWSARRHVTVQLPRDMPLAASRLDALRTSLAFGNAGTPQQSGFYHGRQVARFMTFHGADWLVRPEREETELPEKVLDSLGMKPGDVVADLGAGVGYFSLRMAKRVGPSGKVLAVDIQPEMLERLVRRAKATKITNVVPVLATESDPKLPERGVQLVLLVDVYHELGDPAPVIAAVRRALLPKKKGGRPGRLVLVEYRGEDPTIAIKPLHRTTEQQARAELEAVGFRWVETKRFLPMQHILIFEPTE